MSKFQFQPNMEKKAFPTAEKFSMTEKVQYADGSVVSKIIIRNEKGNITLFAFDKGEFLSEHAAPFDAIVQVLDGVGEVVIDGISVQLNVGESIIMPANVNFKQNLTVKIEDLSVMILLPIFFAFTGLRTQIGLLNEGNLWITCGIVFLTAVIGKIGGSTLSARFVGQTWKDSISLGVLMNTRGLIELVVLNIGYDLGILSPEIFTIMVLMALATTFMTGPLLNLINKLSPQKTIEEDSSDVEG